MIPRELNLIFHTISNAGGVGRGFTDLIREFAGRGIKVRVIARRVDESVLPGQNVETVVLPTWRPFQRWSNLEFENRALKFCKPGAPIICASRVTGGNVDVAIVGGTHLKHLIRKGKSPDGFWDKRILAHEKKFYSNSKNIIAHSRLIEEELKEAGVPAEKIHCNFPPAYVEIFNLEARKNRAETRKNWGAGENQFLLAFPSNNHELKGAPLILEAMEKFGDKMRLVVASSKPIEHPLALNIGFQKNMAPVYAAADASILASKYEAFGRVAIESILCGTPALISEFCGAKDVLSAPACTVFKRNTTSLEAALSDALEKFSAGTLPLAEPEKFVHYPYSVKLYADALLRLID